MVQWLGRCAFIAEGKGSIPGRELRSRKPRSVAKKKKKRKEGRKGKESQLYCSPLSPLGAQVAHSGSLGCVSG